MSWNSDVQEMLAGGSAATKACSKSPTFSVASDLHQV